MQRVPMTVQGAKKLRQQLEQLKRVERPAIVAAISEARAHGDLKENAEYHSAREKQGFIEAKIADIESKLSHAQVVDISSLSHDGKVIFGVFVDLLNVDNEQQVSYHIVGDDEADIAQGKVSVNAPLARALIGKMEGDEVTVRTPSGDIIYEIIAVRYR